MQRFENQLFEEIASQLNSEQKYSLDRLVQLTDDPELSLPDIKEGPGAFSVTTVLRETAKLKRIQEIGLPSSLFKRITSPVLKKYGSKLLADRVGSIRALKEGKKYALLAIYCHMRSSQLIDNLAELLSRLIHKVRTKSESRVKMCLLSDLLKVDGKHTLLLKIAKVSLKDPKGIIENVVFPEVSQETLQRVIDEHDSQGAYQNQIHRAMRSSYACHYRRMIKPIFETLSFQCNNEAYQPLLDAIEVIKIHLQKARRIFLKKRLSL